MKAIILAGGFGTRLRHILPDCPKPMAPIGGKPFLDVLLTHLKTLGFTEFTLSVHYLKDQIIEHFRDWPEVRFAVEDAPLGTGGAILNSLGGEQGDVVVFNGDTWLEIDFPAFFARHTGELTLALRAVDDTDRYGRVEVNGTCVTEFCEKGMAGPGLINGGTYILNAAWLKAQALPQKFSFETDFMAHRHPQYYVTDGYFIDIGVPDDYRKAQHDLA